MHVRKHTLLDLSPREATAAREIALRYGNRPDALLEILHDLQEHLGFVPEAALPALAKALNLSRAEVHGVVTFYHDYQPRARRPPRHQGLPGRSLPVDGGNELVGMIERYLKVKLGQTTADGAITVEAVYCLGNCALSPAIMVDDKLVGRVDAQKFEKIVAECRS